MSPSRRVRGPAAYRAAGGEPPLASRSIQNSQRVPDAKPRTAPMARRRDGDIAPYRNGTAQRDTGGAHGKGPRNGARAWSAARGRMAIARDTMPRTAPGAWRGDGGFRLGS